MSEQTLSWYWTYKYNRKFEVHEGAAVVEWLISWLAEQEVRSSIPGLATWISEIDFLLPPSPDMAEIPLKWRKSSMQPTKQRSMNLHRNTLGICVIVHQYLPSFTLGELADNCIHMIPPKEIKSLDPPMNCVELVFLITLRSITWRRWKRDRSRVKQKKIIKEFKYLAWVFTELHIKD